MSSELKKSVLTATCCNCICRLVVFPGVDKFFVNFGKAQPLSNINTSQSTFSLESKVNAQVLTLRQEQSFDNS